MKLAEAARIVRKELLIRDQPIKAHELLKKLNLSELQKELELTKACIAHVFDKERYIKYYSEELKEEPFQEGTLFKRWEWVLLNTDQVYTAIDLGCADGTLVGLLAEKGIEATGINLYKPSIDYAKQKYPKGKFFVLDAFDVKGKYDMVVAQEIIEHIPDDKAFIKHCASLTDGWVYLTTPDGPVLDGAGNRENWEHRGDGVRGHIRAYNEETLRELLKDYTTGEFKKDTDNGVKYLYVRYKRA